MGDMSSDAKKQKTIVESIVAPKYNQSHPQQKKITNAMTAMLCLDGRPVNLVSGDGFKHLMETVDPRYTTPAPSTFQRTHIPKMKQAVEARLKEKLQNLKKNEISVAFCTDGLDAHDAQRSAIYDFSIYFLEGTTLQCETLYVKKLQSPITSLVIKTFLIECLKGAGFLSDNGKPFGR